MTILRFLLRAGWFFLSLCPELLMRQVVVGARGQDCRKITA
jgi:hypothetical protein